MKRRLLKVGLLLLAGAIVNVAVAWVFALCFSFSSERSVIGGPYDGIVLKAFPRLSSIPHGMIYCGRTDRLGLRYEDVIPRIDCWYAHLETGFPVLALEGTQYIQSPPVAGTRLAGSLLVVTRPDGRWVKRRAVPLQPILPGFALNTIFYGATCWLLFAVPAMIRRRVRIKRGLCPACAYPIGTSDTCTECGNAIVRRGTINGGVAAV